MGITVFVGKGTRSERLLLCTFFICIGFSLLCKTLIWNPSLNDAPSWINNLIAWVYVVACLAKGPALFYYIHPPKAKVRFLLIFLCALSICCVIATLAVAIGVDRICLQNHFTGHQWGAFLFIGALGIVPWTFALAALARFYSRNQTQRTALFMLCVGFIAVWTWGLIAHFLGSAIHLYFGNHIPHMIGLANNYAIFILIGYLLVHDYHRNIPPSVLSDDSEVSTVAPNESQDAAMIAAIDDALTIEQCFLDKRLNLSRFAEHLDYPAKDVSRVINQHYHCSFVELMNQHRLARAQELLLADQALAIQSVAEASGFHSVSSFYRLFKHAYGTTPTQLRQQASRNS